MMRIPRPHEIRELRLKAGLTQAQLAKLARVTQAYIAKLEADAVDPRASTLDRILRALQWVSGERITAERIMTSPITYVRPRDKIRKVVRLMQLNDISQLPVLDGAAQVGSISEATLMREIAAGRNPQELVRRSVKRVMDEPFPVIGKDTSINEVYHLLERSQAVLVANRGRPVGIITKADLLKQVGEFDKAHP